MSLPRETNEREFLPTNAEAALREHVVRTAMLFTAGVNGDFIEANRVFLEKSGYTSEELKQFKISDICLPEDPNDSTAAFLQKIKSGETIQSTFQVHRSDDSHLWAKATAIPIFDSARSVVRFTCVLEDITESRSYQQKSLQLQQLLEATSSVAKIGGWEVDLIAKKMYWSELTRAIHEVDADFEPDLSSGINFYKEGADRDRIQAAVSHAIEQNEAWDEQLQLVTAKGREIWVRARGQPVLVNGRCERLYGTFEDITNERDTLTKLKKQLSLLDGTLSAATNTIIIAFGREGKILLFNKGAQRLLGYSAEEAEKLTLRDLFADPDEIGPLADSGFLEKLFRDKTDLRKPKWESTFLTKGGSCLPVAVTISPISKNGEAQANYLCVAEDISALVEKQQELAQASSAKSDFLASMSHEIRTPMNGIIGMTNLLLDSPGLGEEQRQCGQVIKSSADALLRLINDILDFSKVEAGLLELEEIEFNLRDVLSDFSSVMGYKARSKGISFDCSVDPSVPNSLIGDYARLRQILLNLAGNAVKFTEQGRVSVAIGLESSTELSATLDIRVRDTGIGIDPEQAASLFDKFSQANNSISRKYGGSGLGLAICKQLSELMGGNIGATGQPGKGSTFWVKIPFKRLDPKDREARYKELLSGNRVLVVDDDEQILTLIKAYLESWNIEPILCSSASCALQRIYENVDRGTPIKCALVDFRMPHMDGATFARIVRKDPLLKETFLVLLTGMGNVDELEPIKAKGFDAFCSKPMRPSDLFDIFVRVFESRSGTGRNELDTLVKSFKNVKARILLVEDNTVNQLVAQGILAKLGFAIDAVGSGEEAIEQLSKIDYDIVFMDVQMPGIDGTEATRLIREEEKLQRNPKAPKIIAMTAHARPEDREMCLRAGMDDYISKPIDIVTVARILGKYLTLPASASANARTSVQPTLDAAASSYQSDEADSLIFDIEGLNNRLLGDSSLTAKVVKAALRDIPSDLTQLQTALSEANFQAAGAAAHSIKGSAKNAGLNQLGAIAFRCEKACHESNLASAKVECNQMSNTFAETRQAAIKELMS